MSFSMFLLFGVLEGILPQCGNTCLTTQMLSAFRYPSAHQKAKKQPPTVFFSLFALSGFESLVIIIKGTYLYGMFLLFGVLEGIRTPDPLVRSQILYPTELQARMFQTRIL